VAELAALVLGAGVACDVRIGRRLAAALALVSDGHPIGGLCISAGVVMRLCWSLTSERLMCVAAEGGCGVYLHELTVDLDLTAFVLFSSVGWCVRAFWAGITRLVMRFWMVGGVAAVAGFACCVAGVGGPWVQGAG